jgi:hypothetical protein
MTAHGSMHVLLEPLAHCGFPGCGNESFLICRLCTKGICVHHLVKCNRCPDYFCTGCIEAHAENQHPDPATRTETTAAPGVLAGGQATDLYVRFRPPVLIPGHGHVEVEVHGDTAIVRVVDRHGDPVEVWPNAALVRRKDELLVLLGGHQC